MACGRSGSSPSRESTITSRMQSSSRSRCAAPAARDRSFTPVASHRRRRTSSHAPATAISCTAIRRSASRRRFMQRLRESNGLTPLVFGVAGYVVCRATEAAAQREVARITDVHQSAAGYANYEQWLPNTPLEQRASLEDYSVSNRRLKAGPTGTPEQIADQGRAFEQAGVD